MKEKRGRWLHKHHMAVTDHKNRSFLRGLESLASGALMLNVISPCLDSQLGCGCYLEEGVAQLEAEYKVPIFGVITVGAKCKSRCIVVPDLKPRDYVLPNGHTYVVHEDNVNFSLEDLINAELPPAFLKSIAHLIARVKLHQEMKLRCLYVTYVHEKEAQSRNLIAVASILGAKPGTYQSSLIIDHLACHFTEKEVGNGKEKDIEYERSFLRFLLVKI